jgi:hypothetical protein
MNFSPDDASIEWWVAYILDRVGERTVSDLEEAFGVGA